jgi:hypothetical protein
VVAAAVRLAGLPARLLGVWLVLAALLAAVVVLEYRDVVASRLAETRDPRLLLPMPVAQLSAVDVADGGTLHRFERDAAGAWFYHGTHGAADPAHTHTTDPTVAARIEQVLQAFGRTRIEREVTRDRDPRAYGVAPPRVLILVYRAAAAQPVAQYAVGDVAPDTVSRYVDVVGGAGIVTIPAYQIDNVMALIDSVRSAPR